MIQKIRWSVLGFLLAIAVSVVAQSPVGPVPGGIVGAPTAITPSGGSTMAPSTATYLLQTSNASLPNAQALGALGSGLVLNATTTGVQSIYGGSTCTNQAVTALNASGTATCTTITSAYLDSTVTGISVGSSTSIPTFTVNAQGRLTAATSVTPQLTLSSTYFSSLAAANLTGILGASGILSARITADVNATTNTVLADVTDMTLTVLASTNYRYKAHLFLVGDTVGGIKIGLAGTATVNSLLLSVVGSNLGAAGVPLIATEFSSATLASNSTSGTGAGFNTSDLDFEGAISINAGGTLKIQFAQSASNGTSTAKRNSYVELIPTSN